MAILQRFWTVLKSNLNHWIGQSEDPEKMLNQMLLDMQEQLITAKKQVAVSIADEKRLKAQHTQEFELAQEWEKKAMLAVKAGNDQLAMQALERKTEHEKLANGFEEQWTAQKASVEQLKAALVQLNEKINDAKRKKNLLIARAKRAEAQKTINETMTGIGQTNAFDTIERMEEKIARMEAESEAAVELANEAVTDQLEKQFESLQITETSDALAALKAKMGVANPAALGTSASSDEQAMKEIEKQINAEVSAKRS